jgi:glycosyltransferase involved in cell wall biosynthesis
MPNDAVPAVFSGADLFCLPSHYEREAMPLVILEAMRHALAVVATDWRGIPSMVTHGETGFLVPVRDPDAVADRLQQLIQNPDLRRRMGDSGRRRFERDFTVERFVARMEEVLLSV